MRSFVKIIDRYILLEIFTPFWVSLFVFTGVLFLARSLKLVDLVVNKNIPITDILLLFSFLIPRFLELAIPMSLLLSVILAFGRLSADSELVVMRCSGMNLRRLSVPVLVFAVFCFLFTLATSLWIRPWANYRLALGMFEVAKTQASAGLTQGIFNELGQLTIYAEEVREQGSNLRNVIISDRRDEDSPKTFVAAHGQLLADDASRRVMLRLYDGNIQDGTGLDYSITYFDINNITIDQADIASSDGEAGKGVEEMYIDELLTAVAKAPVEYAKASDNEKEQKRYNRQNVELHKRFVIPAACLCMAFIAMALGVQPSRGGKSWGLTVSILAGIAVIILFYLLIAIAKALGEQGILPSGPAMWLPNIVFYTLAIFLFQKMGSEQWMAVSEAVSNAFARVMIKLRLGAGDGTKA